MNKRELPVNNVGLSMKRRPKQKESQGSNKGNATLFSEICQLTEGIDWVE
jgi:hypothetical protein